MEKAHIIGRKIVTVGGGSGGFLLNQGLLQYPVSRTAIATVFDNGGSTGRQRDAHGVLPSGDLRRLLVALSDEDGDTLRKLFSYRFPEGNGSFLKEESLGNIIMTAAEKLWGRRDALRRLSDLLDVNGTVLPISLDDAHLIAELSDGSILRGETLIDRRDPSDTRTIRKVWLEPDAFILRESAEALMNADVIVLGPGDHYTSLIPNLLVRGFAEAIERSQAKLVYVANLMTKAAETRGFTLLSFVEDLLCYGVGRDQFDAVVLNIKRPPEELLAAYREKEFAEMVLAPDKEQDRLRVYAGTIVTGNYLDDASLRAGLIRHDSAKLVRALLAL